jgi:hypothetical protein
MWRHASRLLGYVAATCDADAITLTPLSRLERLPGRAFVLLMLAGWVALAAWLVVLVRAFA